MDRTRTSFSPHRHDRVHHVSANLSSMQTNDFLCSLILAIFDYSFADSGIRIPDFSGIIPGVLIFPG
jgi:hypothetical protein